QLRGGLVEVGTTQAGEIDALDQLPVDTELQILIGALDLTPSTPRRAAAGVSPRRRRYGLRVRAQSDAVSQLHFRTSLVKIRCRRWPRLALAAPPTPVRLAASSPIASPSGDCLPPF